MGTFANPTALFDNSANGPSVETALRLMRANQRAIMELPGAMPAERCEIQGEAVSDGFIEPTRSDIIVSLPENYSSTSAVIKSISNSYTNENNVAEFLHEGMIISLRSEFSGYTINVVSSAANGGILLKNAESVTLSEKYPLKLKLVNLAGSAYRWEECAESGVHSGDWELVSGDLEVTGLVRSDGVVLQRELIYDTTPVVNIEIASGTTLTATSDSPYEIDLSAYQAKRVYLGVLAIADTVGKTGSIVVSYDNGSEYVINCTFTRNGSSHSLKAEFFDSCGFADGFAYSYNSYIETHIVNMNTSLTPVDVRNSFINKVSFYLSTSPYTLLSGTQIKVYVATYRTI